jgi:hypothetical protein
MLFLKDALLSGNEISVDLDFIDDEPHFTLQSKDELNEVLKEQLTKEICTVLNHQYPSDELKAQCYHHSFQFIRCQCGTEDCKNTVLVHTEVGEF